MDFQKKFKNQNINLNQNFNILKNNNCNRNNNPNTFTNINNSNNIINNDLNFNAEREGFYSAACTKSIGNNNLIIYKLHAEKQHSSDSHCFFPKKFKTNKNIEPYRSNSNYSNDSNAPNIGSFRSNSNFIINNNNFSNLARSKLEEVDNNFFFESEKATSQKNNFNTNNNNYYTNSNNFNNLINFNNNNHDNHNNHNNNNHNYNYKSSNIKSNQESVFHQEALAHNHDNYLFNVFTQKPANSSSYLTNKPEFHSANNSPWRSGRSFNSQENFSVNNSNNLMGLDESNFLRNQFHYYTPGNSPGRIRPYLHSNFNSPQANKNLNLQSNNNNINNNKNKASLFNNFEKEEKAEEFKDLEELLGSIDCELWLYSSSQKGSRNLQKLLNKILPQELNVILQKVKDHFSFLMTDTYGNYFCQKLIQCCSSEQRVFILKHVSL